MGIRKQVKICHVTSGHSRYDVRIFQKECRSLAKKGYDVSLIVNDELEDEIIDGIKIYSTRFKPQNRFQRMLLSIKKMKELVRRVDADIYHLHDSELLLTVNYLKAKHKKVVFDSHEDYLHAIDDKRWIPSVFKKIVKTAYKTYEKKVLKKIDAAIVCYHWTEDRYNLYCKKVKMVLNFPIIKAEQAEIDHDLSNRSISFAGLISEMWCHREIIEACYELENVTYELAGKLDGEYGESLKQSDGWKIVNYHGVLHPNEVYQKVYARSSIGIALLDYISLCNGNVGNLANTKLFEAMHAGLPIICTNFILWKRIIDEENCGICVDPHNKEEIKQAISKLINNPSLTKKMGENGKRAVIDKYNWNYCEKELFEVYDYLANDK